MQGLVDWVATSWGQVKKAQSSKVAGGCLVENGPTPDSRRLMEYSGQPAADSVQSMVAPLARIGPLHRSISLTTNLARYSGPLRSGAMTPAPMAVKRSRTEGVS